MTMDRGSPIGARKCLSLMYAAKPCRYILLLPKCHQEGLWDWPGQERAVIHTTQRQSGLTAVYSLGRSVSRKQPPGYWGGAYPSSGQTPVISGEFAIIHLRLYFFRNVKLTILA